MSEESKQEQPHAPGALMAMTEAQRALLDEVMRVMFSATDRQHELTGFEAAAVLDMAAHLFRNNLHTKLLKIISAEQAPAVRVATPDEAQRVKMKNCFIDGRPMP